MAEPSKPTKSVEVFFSYSHKDEDLRDELSKRLAMLKRQNVITAWHDRRIGAGKEWENEIDEYLNTADIILLLISSDFLASDYCYDTEVKTAMKRHDAGEARVIPVVLRPVDWKGAPFGKLQSLPKDTRPVTDWPNRDKAFENIAQGIRVATEELVISFKATAPWVETNLFMADLAAQPGAGHAPIAFDRGRRNPERFGRLFNCQPAEIAQLHDPRLLWIKRLQPPERFIEREQVDVSFFGHAVRLAQ